MATADSETFKMTCDCGSALRVPRSAIVRKAKCPKCQSVVVIAEPREEEDESEFRIAGFDDAPYGSQPSGVDADDGGSAADEFAASAASAASAAAKAAAPSSADVGNALCSNCKSPMAENAVLCVSCGFNRLTGKVVGAAGVGGDPDAAESKKKRKGGEGRSFTGTFLLGCVLSAVGAMIGGAVWVGVAIASGYEIGYIAWGLGLLAGLGMKFGLREESPLGGVTAAGISLFGIAVVKAALVIFLVGSYVVENMEGPEDHRTAIAEYETEKVLRARPFDPDNLDRRSYEQLHREEMDRQRASLAGMDDAALLARRMEIEEGRYSGDPAVETDQKRYQLLDHRLALEAEKHGLWYDSNRYQKLNERISEEVMQMSDAEVEHAAAEMQTWKAEARWEDEEYVRARLVAAKVERDIAERWRTDENFEGMNEPEWKRLRRTHESDADEMSPEARVAALRDLEVLEELESKRLEVVSHRVELERLRRKIPHSDDEMETIRADIEKEVAALPRPEFDEAFAAAKEWDKKGREQDESYQRDRLADLRATAEADRRPDVEWGTPEWRKIWDAEREEVEAVPTVELARDIKAEDEKAEQRWNDFRAEMQASAQREALGEAASGFGQLYAAMFSPMDLLFAGLAVITAFGVGSGQGTDE